MVWLFTIPSLRARKPVAAEKNALNVAFVVCPLANIVIPFVNKVCSTKEFTKYELFMEILGYFFALVCECVPDR
jgi:hypothetical protein